MLDSFLDLIRDRLQGAVGVDHTSPPKVVLVDRPAESVTFKVDKLSILLANVQEERVMRGADPYVRHRGTPPGRTVERVHPEIRLTLLVLIVSNFKDTKTSWLYLSKVLEFFRVNRVIETNADDKSADFDQRLQFELVSQTLAEQNELWSALKAPLHPSLLYRVNLIAIQDKPTEALPLVNEDKIEVTVVTAPKLDHA